MKVLAIPFRVSNGAIATSENYDDVVRWQVLDCAATNLSERVMRPQWGINARDYLMRPSERLELDDTANVVRQRLVTGVPRATITGVSIDSPDIQPNLVNIDVRYKTSRFTGAQEATVTVTTTTQET